MKKADKIAPDPQQPTDSVESAPEVPAATKRFSEEYITKEIPKVQAAGDIKSLKWVERTGKQFGICSKFGELAFENGDLFLSDDRAEVEALVRKLRPIRPNDDIRVSIH